MKPLFLSAIDCLPISEAMTLLEKPYSGLIRAHIRKKIYSMNGEEIIEFCKINVNTNHFTTDVGFQIFALIFPLNDLFYRYIEILFEYGQLEIITDVLLHLYLFDPKFTDYIFSKYRSRF